jgi:putative endonuclease
MVAEHWLLGRLGERTACRFLLRQGYDILARRFRSRTGELDVIAFEGETLVFVEVKTRASREFGAPWEFVDWAKRQNLRRAAEEFIARHDLGGYAYRFDIVAITAPGRQTEEIALFRNAW